MSSIEKLKHALKERPKTFDWLDMVRVLSEAGYTEVKTGKTSGSRMKFINAAAAPIVLHKPHHGNQMKAYAVKLIAEQLESEGLL